MDKQKSIRNVDISLIHHLPKIDFIGNDFAIFDDIKDMCRGAEVKSGLNLKFSGTAMKTKKDEIEKWTENIKQGGEL